jgi:hypothetical protein
MTWRIAWSEALHADLDIAGPELFDRAGHAVRRFAEKGEGKAYPVDGPPYRSTSPRSATAKSASAASSSARRSGCRHCSSSARSAASFGTW